MSGRTDKYTWNPGDIELVEQGPHWDLSYRAEGFTCLVQDAGGLMQHLMQTYPDMPLGDVFEVFMRSGQAALMPPGIQHELEALGVIDARATQQLEGQGMSGGSPFVSYPGAGAELLKPPPWGDGTARHGYGLKVLEYCGFRCAYCGLDMGTFDGWLQLSIDHVVPQQMAKSGWPSEWLLDTINVVACCMTCNGLFNRDVAPGTVPNTLEEFVVVRDALFQERRRRIAERRQTERRFFETRVAPLVSTAR
jgi:hypothetical protein